MASVLLVEDESLIRMMVADMLTELGHTVGGEAGGVVSGLMLASAPGIDAAILDVQLGSDSSEPIAEALHQRGIHSPSLSDTARKACPKLSRTIPFCESPSRWSLNAAWQRCWANKHQ
jgi:DNA-binding response OmpR family regulator